MEIWQLDRELYRAIHVSWHRDWLDLPMVGITSTGLGWVQALALVAVFCVRPLRRLALLLFGAGAFCGLLRLGVMRLADRQRPSNYVFAKPMEEVFGMSSFPSGHTACSFAIATMLLLLVRGTEWEWTGRAAIVWAALVGFSRVYLGVHYPTDVVGGMLFGVLTAALFYWLAERRGWLEKWRHTGAATANLPN